MHSDLWDANSQVAINAVSITKPGADTPPGWYPANVLRGKLCGASPIPVDEGFMIVRPKTKEILATWINIRISKPVSQGQPEVQ